MNKKQQQKRNGFIYRYRHYNWKGAFWHPVFKNGLLSLAATQFVGYLTDVNLVVFAITATVITFLVQYYRFFLSPGASLGYEGEPTAIWAATSNERVNKQVATIVENQKQKARTGRNALIINVGEKPA